jgi:hypothetical protein
MFGQVTGWGERDGGAQPPPALSVVTGPSVQRPAVQRQPLPQTDQPPPRPGGGRGAAAGPLAVVADRDLQPRSPTDQNIDNCFPRMPYHVRQPLLHHAVRGQVKAGRQLARRPGDGQPYGRPRRRHPVDQRPQARQPGLRAQLPLLVAGRAEQTEQVAQLGHRAPAAGLHRQQRLLGVLRGGGDHLAGRARLYHHHADVVRDDVVQFGRDPGPLPPQRRDGGSLVLGLRATQPCRRVAESAAQLADAEGHRHRGHHRDQRGVPFGVMRQRVGEHDRRRDRARRYRGDRQLPVPAIDDRAERREQRRPERQRRDPVVHQQRGGYDHRPRRHRELAAEQQRRRGQRDADQHHDGYRRNRLQRVLPYRDAHDLGVPDHRVQVRAGRSLGDLDRRVDRAGREYQLCRYSALQGLHDHARRGGHRDDGVTDNHPAGQRPSRFGLGQEADDPADTSGHETIVAVIDGDTIGHSD